VHYAGGQLIDDSEQERSQISGELYGSPTGGQRVHEEVVGSMMLCFFDMYMSKTSMVRGATKFAALIITRSPGRPRPTLGRGACRGRQRFPK